MSIQYFTKEGLENLKNELHQLKTVDRPKISAQIAEARDKGDLSENAEYDAAKEAQGLLEHKISQMEQLLGNARVLDESKMDISKVMVLSKVKVKNHKTNAILNYQLVSEKEADLKTGRISIKSPIGLALLGLKQGEKVDITVPAGVITLEILEISI
ncbi:MAG: transcription elongation factor GreA [Bacteroidetes bacterium]|nr:transcription elongation factor GreA [Bacteroidota bacterium]